jgi:transcription elongation factor GreA
MSKDTLNQGCAVRTQPYFYQENSMSSLTKVPLTVIGANALKAELQRLKSVDRPAVIVAISEARAQGDLSENAEYDAAKEKQGFIEGRIQELESKLSSAQIIDPQLLDDDGRVVFAATVDLEEVETGEKVTYQIVGEDEANIKLGKISFSSPISRAMIGKYAGDVVVVRAPGGEKEYEIVDVKYL